MTEAEWLACGDPKRMLESLPSRASDRKLRLFAVACCRRVWHLLTDQRSRTAVEFTEWYADGELSGEEVRQASSEAYRAWEDAGSVPDDPGEPPDKVLYGSSRPWRQRPYEGDPVARRYLAPHRGIARFHAAYAAFLLTVSAVERVISDTQEAVWFGTAKGQRSAVATEEQAQSDLLHDILGNPFRPVALDPAWRTPDVQTLARSAYEERTLPEGTLEPARLGLLADALEDAGCTSAEILNHLRAPGVHVRGCWAFDLLLGKG